MGSLDDAIREHLELKRRLGASDEEIERKENEAFGKGTFREPASSQGQGPDSEESFAEAELATAEPGSNGQPEETVHDTADYADAAAAPDEPDEPARGLEEELFEPDEVPREESLDPGLTVRDARRSHDEESEPSADWVKEPERDTSEDVLEETPEFLEETPEGDSLWFDQRPPKDFDFD